MRVNCPFSNFRDSKASELVKHSMGTRGCHQMGKKAAEKTYHPGKGSNKAADRRNYPSAGHSLGLSPVLFNRLKDDFFLLGSHPQLGQCAGFDLADPLLRHPQ